MVANPQMMKKQAAMQQALGPGQGQGNGNGEQPSLAPPGMMPAQSAGEPVGA